MMICCIRYLTISRVDCKDGRCAGYNERKNIFNAARHFATFLLPHGAPSALRKDVDAIVSAYSNVTITSQELLMRLNRVISDYKSGRYLLPREQYPSAIGKQLALVFYNGKLLSMYSDFIIIVFYTAEYKSYPLSDLPGLFDYRCRYSVASGICTVSVFDQHEAEQLCNNDPDCNAFVLSPHRTWTGIYIYIYSM